MGEAGEASAPQTIDSEPGAGTFISIDVNSQNEPAIAYFAAANADLRLATMSGDAWQTRTMDARGSVGQYPSLLIDAQGLPNISYYAKSTGDLRLAKYIATTDEVAREVVDSAGDGRTILFTKTDPQHRPAGDRLRQHIHGRGATCRAATALWRVAVFRFGANNWWSRFHFARLLTT